MPLAKGMANAKRTVVAVRREDVVDIAAVGGMWFVKTTDRLYVTHCSWYPQFSEPDVTMMRELLLSGWSKNELGERYDVHPSIIASLFEGDHEVAPKRAPRGVRWKQRRMKKPKRYDYVGKGMVFG